MTKAILRQIAACGLLVSAFMCASCGRTPLFDPVCSLTVSPSSLDLGEVGVGKQAGLSVTLSSGHGSVCHLSGIGLRADSDSAFALAPRTSTSLTLGSQEQVTVHVTFRPTEVSVPLQRTGTLLLSSDDPAQGTVEVPLVGRIHSDCRLAILPTSLDFGRVPMGDSASANVQVMNTGSSECAVGQIALTPDSDPQFAVDDRHLVLAPGAAGFINAGFRASDSALPRHRTGQLTFATTDPAHAQVTVPLSANIVVCSLSIRPSSLDFGEVAPGSPVTLGLDIEVASDGATCVIFSIGLRPDSDPGFSVEPDAPVGVALLPGTQIALATTFDPARVRLPLQRSGTLVLTSNDPLAPTIEVPLAARIHSECRLSVAPESVNLGNVMLDTSATGTVRIINNGKGPCEITDLALTRDSDRQFALAPLQDYSFVIDAGGERAVSVIFRAEDAAEPHHRTGRLAFTSTDPQRESITVPLSADVDLGCVLSVTPTRVDFGSLILNTSANASVALVNQGTQPCVISSLSMKAGSDSGFALGASQASSLTLPVGDKNNVSLRFDAYDSSPPHQKNATLLIESNDRKSPQLAVPLTALVDTVCVEASRWIYTVEGDTTFSRFDPDTVTFTDIAKLKCDSPSSPFSMAVDQKAVAWVLYQDGKLFKVNTTTGKCESTDYQDTVYQAFGMGFVFDPSTGQDTLYIAGGQSMRATCNLATIAFPSLKVTTLGQVKEGWPELSGTGDGSLWGFYPKDESTSGYQAALVRLDPRNGSALQTHHYANITEYGSWAMKFWGGQFWIFIEQSIYAVDRDKPQVAKLMKSNTGRDIVGAGVSTCAPLKGD